MPNRLSRAKVLLGDVKVAFGQMQHVLVGTVARSDTSAKSLGTIPAGATVIGISIYAAAASNAVTTATLSLGNLGGTGVEWMNAQDVKTVASGQGQVTPNKGVLGGVGSTAVVVTGTYAETGGASSAGGPWLVTVEYITA